MTQRKAAHRPATTSRPLRLPVRASEATGAGNLTLDGLKAKPGAGCSVAAFFGPPFSVVVSLPPPSFARLPRLPLWIPRGLHKVPQNSNTLPRTGSLDTDAAALTVSCRVMGTDYRGDGDVTPFVLRLLD